MDLDRSQIERLLRELGDRADIATTLEVTLIGGAAGLLTGQLPATRTTVDCDVIQAEPSGEFEQVQALARQIAREQGIADDWFSAQAVGLNVLPAGWQRRRIHIGTFGRLKVWSVGRLDLLATKAYAGRMQDRADLIAMNPTQDELSAIKRYLDQMRIPSRQANLDQVQSALRFVSALWGGR